MDSPKKASVRHIEFHLQREKALSKELEEKCKSLQSQIAQLEQDKAELRREKLLIAEDAKKSAKLDDRIHQLQKEADGKDAVIAAERARVVEARAETEEVRSNAKRTIASWTEAEEQWLTEQCSLNEFIQKLQERLRTCQGDLKAKIEVFDDTAKSLSAERDRSTKLQIEREQLQDDVRALNRQTEALQHRIIDLTQTVDNLDKAGIVQKEALDLKDTEIQTLRAEIGQHLLAEEKMEQSISSLNDRLNTAKMLNLSEKGEKEKICGQLVDLQKQTERLNSQIDSLKRDQSFSYQSQGGLQKTIDDLRERCRSQQEDIKSKTIELRQWQLNCTQLSVDQKKQETQIGEWEFRYSSLKAEQEKLENALMLAHSRNEVLLQDKEALQQEVQDVKVCLQDREEEMVVLQGSLEDKCDELRKDALNLEKEVADRQAIISDLTNQLDDISGKTAFYQGRILEESGGTNKLRHELLEIQKELFNSRLKNVEEVCIREKVCIQTAFFESFCELLMQDAVARSENHFDSISRIHAQLCASIRANNDLTASVAHLEEKLRGETNALVCAQEELRGRDEQLASFAHELDQKRSTSCNLERLLEERRLQMETADAKIAELIEDVRVAREEAQGCRGEAASVMERCTHRERKALIFYAKATAILAQQHEGALDVVSVKQRFFADCVQQLGNSSAKRIQEMLTQCEDLTRRCRELEVLLGDAQASFADKTAAVAKNGESLQAVIISLEAKLKVEQKEKSQISFQLNTLLQRFEEQQRVFEEFKKQSEAALQEERSKVEIADKRCTKLRGGIEYEIKRKTEYKEAVEKIKKLREESESIRRQENELAALAISKANEEATYWINCFDRLKQLVEAFNSSGGSIPPIDVETASRLEEAKSTMKGTSLKQRDVNCETGVRCVKRRREGTGEPA